MITHYNGKITENLYAIGNPGFPAILITADRPAIFDAGIGMMGPLYLEDLNRILGDSGRLRYVFLTHSHFDHCSSVPYLKKKIAGLKTGASRIAAEVLVKPKAVAFIGNLNRDVSAGFTDGMTPDMEFEPLEIDFPFEDGQEFDLGSGFYFQVISTPGHTRDSVSYYFPRLKFLITGEAAGVLDATFKVLPEFVSSYSDYIESLKKIASLDTKYLLLGHGFYVTGEDIETYWQNAIQETKAFRKKALKYLDSYRGDQAAVVEQIYQEDYVAPRTNYQQAGPYLINLEAKVKTIVRERAEAPEIRGGSVVPGSPCCSNES
jgi:2-aminobenzoylacetyl-CoA thioesterase